MIDWSLYPNFHKSEMDCSHTGKNEMRPEFLELLQKIRYDYRKPMIITSGYRDKTHPIEVAKEKPGEHTFGLAADIAVRGEGAMELLQIAMHYGIRRIGLNQKGSGRFVHLGLGNVSAGFPVALWTY